MNANSEKLAIDGGKPVRETMLPYGLHQVTDEDVAAVTEVLKGKWLTTGPTVAQFERALAQKVGAASAAAVSSGTAALHLAYMAAGIGPGDEIITSPLTFAATANAALYVGAHPVFADIDPNTMNLDPEKVRYSITKATRAIVAVHYAGRPCEMSELRAIADEHDLLLIEDACHALGAAYNGQMVGSQRADLSIWSFHPVKHVAAGEGGAVTSPSWRGSEYVERVRRLRNHGIDADAGSRRGWFYQIDQLGYNYRMSDINAALALSQLERLDQNVEARQSFASFYGSKNAISLFADHPAPDDEDHESAWHLYPIRLRQDLVRADRATIFAALRAENIGVNVHYIPVYWHPIYAQLGYKKGLCPVAESCYERLITLPIFASMSASDATDVLEAFSKVMLHYRKSVTP